MGEKIKASELGLGDKVSSFEGAYRTSTVIRIEGDMVTLFRPYVHTSDCETAGGLIPYIGFEEFTIDVSTEVELLERGRVLR